MDSILCGPTEDQECDDALDMREVYKDEGSSPAKPEKVLGEER